MTAAEKLALINKALDQGRTVYLGTQLRAYKLTARVREHWAATGRPVIKVSASGSLMLGEGRRYVCADYCSITID